MTGLRGEGCAWHASTDPFVRAVSAAHRHWAKGALGAVHRRPLPLALLRGIEVFDQALNAVQSFDIKNPSQPPQTLDPPRGGMRVRREPVHRGRRAKS